MTHDSAHQDLEKACGRLIIIGFDGALEQVPHDIEELLVQGHRGGVILFGRNVQDVPQVSRLCQSIHRAAECSGETPLVCIDQEGGRVVRLREPLTPVPTMRTVGEHRDIRDVVALSEVVATELSALGFNVNFAPVLDVDTNPQNPVIGDRSFSADAQRVARYGGAWSLGHATAGVISCAKHFPGHGDTLIDSHLALPTLTHGMQRLFSVELVPFRAAVRVHIPMIMTAHIVMSALDPIFPATLSPEVIGGLLREKMGYEGVVVSDCLEMKAVSAHYEIEELVERSLMAGVDAFLICHTAELQARAHVHLIARAKASQEVRQRVFESAERILKMKRANLGSWPKPWQVSSAIDDVLGCQAHLEVASRFGGGEGEERGDPTAWREQDRKS